MPETLHSPLAPLQVIQRMEVGPARITSRRISIPYRVFQRDRQEEMELLYSYEDPVWDPADAASQNLAAMIGAQVALNYGLFCETMVFHGPFDPEDRRFIRDMMENTAREIFVKKFLEPNPFLTGETASRLTPVKLPRYSGAVLEFPGLQPLPSESSRRRWATEKDRIAVLSSGGKDSLLSYGLLKEAGREVHPLFVNESGRHWFTALNAYRHFRKNIPETGRVWMNADRLFTWMLRRLPFVRQDFANFRSDAYPIRLWTVAVFLFGALPLLRQRGIGRLVIGDESDTTRRASFKGIPHYDGLFDQSRYFDNILSRYFHRKGWGVSQFSILRPMSEMLVQKILAERYPDLQCHQMSCHATHVKGSRIYPCGDCEKCRRIVGMLMATGADPTRCGYAENQIHHSLENIARKGVHQESAGERHLKFMLARQGLLKVPPEKSASVKEHPEILKLRFDPDRSPPDTIPVDLRAPLLRICQDHVEGSVRRQGKIWIDFDPLADPSLHRPYPFEKTAKEKKQDDAGDGGSVSSNHSPLLGELTWPEAEQRFREVDIALLPVGSIEQHGPHLPLDTDAFDADYLAKAVARECRTPKPIVLPLISYGVSYHHDEFKGTFSISNETLSKLVYEIGCAAARNGITKLVIINGHGGNGPALNFAAQMINRDAHIFVCVDTGETSDVDINTFVETPNDVHAGEIETSTSLALRPHLVKLKQAKKRVPNFSSRYLNFSSKRGVSWYAYTKKISSNGVMGDPTKASVEKGEKIWAIMVARLVEFVEDLKDLTLDEIYQQRY